MKRFGRLAALAALLFYCSLLLAAAIPTALVPGSRNLGLLRLGSGFVLHLIGLTPGIEVFSANPTSRAIPKMSCFRIVGEGNTSVVLYDDLASCRERHSDPLRDPFGRFQMRDLSAALVELHSSRKGSLTQAPISALFLFSDYYCHTPEAERAQVRAVSIDAVYLATNLDDGTTGQLALGGRRRCDRPTWNIR